MITKIIKILVSAFLLVVSIILFTLWLTFGTLLLIVWLIRLISLYTIALLNSFASGSLLTFDYNKAIEEAIELYINTYRRIMNMPLLPWQPLSSEAPGSIKALLPIELDLLKKSWIISLIVFFTYLTSLGISSTYIIFYGKMSKINLYEEELVQSSSRIDDLQKKNKILVTEIRVLRSQRNSSVYKLSLENEYSINTLSRIFETSPDSIKLILNY
jgi:hypothetical protein